MTQLFGEFHLKGSVVANAKFFVLILKKGGAEDIKDFKLISLVGNLYKLLAEVLANRLKMMVRKVVSENQSAIVRGRQILDAVLIPNQVVNSRKRSSKAGLVGKLDIEKAYGHPDWKFLLSLLEKMGFGEKVDTLLHIHYEDVSSSQWYPHRF